MFVFIIFILVIYLIIIKSTINNSNNLILFNRISMLKKFSNIQTFPSYVNGYIFKGVDTQGENILFAIKNNSLDISNNDIATIYERATKLHYHNIILVVSSINNTNIINLLNSYNITYWDKNKMLSMINNYSKDNSNDDNINESPTILNTSNTSDDKCTIEESFDPIMDADSKKTSIFSSLFNKPDKL